MPSGNRAASTSKRKLWLAGIVAALAVGSALVFWAMSGTDGTVEYFTKQVESGSIAKIVNATGTVQPVVTVQVGSQVSGQIQTLYADYNSIVQRGQLLAKIDPRNFQAQVADAQANLAAARAREQAARADLGTMQASLLSSQANLNAARVTRDNDAMNYKRYQEMSKTGIVAENDFDNVKTTAESSAAKYEQAEAAVEQAKAQISAQEAQLKQAGAQVRQAEADLEDRRVNLEYTNIFSPVDGVVISRNVDVGQTVAAGLQAPLLFVIANNLTHMQVNASVDEADIGSITPDVQVRFTVDAFPNRVFPGKIEEVRLNPQTVQNVVTYSTIIAVDNSDLYLKPGMTANITMTVDKRDNVLMIPNSALRYAPREVSADRKTDAPQVAETADAADAVPGQKRGFRNPGNGTSFQAGTEAGRGSGFSGNPVALNNKRGGGIVPQPTGSATMDQAPGQLWDPSLKLQFPAVSVAPPKTGSVWTFDSHSRPLECRVKLGITDGVNTEMISGELHAGETLIVGDTSQDKSEPTRSASVMGGALGGFRRF